MPPKKTLVLGENGQLGRALLASPPDAKFATGTEFDVTDPTAQEPRRRCDYGVIINVVAYTAVDASEAPDGRRTAWAST